MIRDIENGDPKAIADLLNRVTNDPSLSFRTSLKGETLGVLVESTDVPDLPTYLPTLKIILILLEKSPIRVVKVYGRQKGKKSAAWTKLFYLKPSQTQPAFLNHRVKETSAPEKPSQRRGADSSDDPEKKKSFWNKIGFKKGSSHFILMGFLFIFYFLSLDPLLFPLADTHRDAAFFTQAVAPATADKTLTPTLPNQKKGPKPKHAGPLIPFDKPTITIKAVGDIIPGTDYPGNRLPQNPALLFSAVNSRFQDADIVFGNLETTLTTCRRTAKNISSANVYAFRTPPAYAALIADAGFNVLNVANNHSMDFSRIGFSDTIRHIESAGMLATGQKGETVYCRKFGFCVAFISFSTCHWHNAIHNLENAIMLVGEAAQEADIIVISIHAGAEGSDALRVKNRTEYFLGENRGNIMRFARKIVDAGADLVLGHGPHVLRGMELYKGKLIAYSLGNFMGYRTLSTAGNLAHSIILEAELDHNGNFIKGNATPVILNRQGIPVFDKQHHGRKLLAGLTKADFPETPLQIDPKGRITAPPSTELVLQTHLKDSLTVQ